MDLYLDGIHQINPSPAGSYQLLVIKLHAY